MVQPGFVSEHVPNRRHTFSVRRTDMHHEVWIVDVWSRWPGHPRRQFAALFHAVRKKRRVGPNGGFKATKRAILRLLRLPFLRRHHWACFQAKTFVLYLQLDHTLHDHHVDGVTGIFSTSGVWRAHHSEHHCTIGNGGVLATGSRESASEFRKCSGDGDLLHHGDVRGRPLSLSYVLYTAHPSP